jgi:predicted HicB family RNase H-like nuclease
MSARKPQTQDKFVLRLPEGMRKQIAAEADANARSMTQEVVLAIRAHLSGRSARQQDYTRYTIRVPQALYEQVSAASGEKSVNAEICEALDAFYNRAPATDLRDRFAEAALVGLPQICAQDTLLDGMTFEQHVARNAYRIADAMMAEKERTP